MNSKPGAFMESVDTDKRSIGREGFRIEEVTEATPALVANLIEIDLQTFSESTFSEYAAAAMLRNGRVFLLFSGESIIGTCVTMRCWDRPQEAMLLSMGIKPGWRGQGLGQQFVKDVLEKLKQRGLRSACLYVGTDNRRAISVYKDVGFESIEIGPSGAYGSELMLMRVTLQKDPPVVML